MRYRCTLIRTPPGSRPDVEAVPQEPQQASRGKKPIWITELGWATSGHDWAISPFRATEAQQAQYLTQSFNKLLKARGELRLQRVFWFEWQDQPDPDGSWFVKMGLLRADGSPKPAYSAYQAEARR